MPEAIPEFGYTAQTYSLMCRGDKYQWRTNDGVALSPEFTTRQCAMRYQQVMSMITDAEWLERDGDEYHSRRDAEADALSQTMVDLYGQEAIGKAMSQISDPNHASSSRRRTSRA